MKSAFAKKQNTHLEHPEDVLFMEASGVKDIKKIFSRIISGILSGRNRNQTITIKYDGAPAVIYGRDPLTGKTFLGTKGVFAKQSVKAYSQEDIEHLWKGELMTKLSALWKKIKAIEFDSVVQGDLLFVGKNNDLKSMTIEGDEYLTFRPNTIMYGAKSDSPLADRLKKSKLGLINHTSYVADDQGNLSISTDLPSFKLPKKIRSPHLKASLSVPEEDVESLQTLKSGISSFDIAPFTRLHQRLSMLDEIISKPFSLAGSTETKKKVVYKPSLISLVERYIVFTNKCIRDGKKDQTPGQIYDYFVEYYLDLYLEKIKKLTRERDITCYTRGYRLMKVLLQRYKHIGIDAIQSQKEIITYKYELMHLLNASVGEEISCFLPQGDSYVPAGHEGFVVRDKTLGAAIKLVDRQAFSRANFIEPKLWGKTISHVEGEKTTSTLMLFARMNPPTKKHIDIIRQMVAMAKDSGSDYHFFLSHTQDSNNPLSQELKARMITAAVPGIRIVFCGEEVRSLYDAVSSLAQQGYKQLGIIGGADRMDTISEIQERKDAYGFDSVVGINMGERKQGDDLGNMENMSASKVRQLAQQENYAEFVSCFDSEIPQELIQEAYDAMRAFYQG